MSAMEKSQYNRDKYDKKKEMRGNEIVNPP